MIDGHALRSSIEYLLYNQTKLYRYLQLKMCSNHQRSRLVSEKACAIRGELKSSTDTLSKIFFL